MADKIGWRFPPTNGGLADGFNDSGIAHFSGNPVASLARETIQNSLDAKAGSRPVEMSFEIQEVGRSEALGRGELTAAIEACLKEVDESEDDDKARTMFTEASRLLRRSRLPYLRVADRNTTGLHDRHWRALVKMQGASVKEKRGAGGSHGIGKNAPFAVSPLRTVYYWTRFGEGDRSVEQFQGKAVLISHKAADNSGVDDVETQGTGFYGIVDGCRELRGEAVPERISRVENGSGRGNGTSLWIAGFDRTGNWQRRIATSVIENFFHAIDCGNLSVTIDPSEELEERQLVEIDKKTISAWFDYLLPEEDQDGEEYYTVAQAYQFWEIIRSGDPVAEKEDNDLGHVRLWIQVSDGLPNKVGFVRGTGMLITTQQRGLLRFRGLRDFIAVCVFDSEKGNELLRGMENPQHNQFEPDRLADDGERRRGQAALNRVTKWIRGELNKHAAPTLSDTATDLDELAQYLPDVEPEEGIDPPTREKGEFAFGGSNVVRMKPRRTIARKSSLLNDEVGDGDGADTGHAGGGGEQENDGDGGGGGHGEGDGSGGSGTRGGARGRDAVAVVDVRMVPVMSARNRYRVSFTARDNGRVRIKLGEAGDSTGIERSDIRAFGPDGAAMALDDVELKLGKRVEFEITGAGPIGGRAWRVHAIKKG